MCRRGPLLVVVATAGLWLGACNSQEWKQHWKPVKWEFRWDWWRSDPTPEPGAETPAWSRPTTRKAGPVPATTTRPEPAEHVTRSLSEWRVWWSQYEGFESAVVRPVCGVTVQRGRVLVAIELGPGEARRIRNGDEYKIHPIDSERQLARARVFDVNQTAGEVYARIVHRAEGTRDVRVGDLAALQAPVR